MMSVTQKPILRERRRGGGGGWRRFCSFLSISASCKLSSPPFSRLEVKWRSPLPVSLPGKEESGVKLPLPYTEKRTLTTAAPWQVYSTRRQSPRQARGGPRTASRMSITSQWNFAILKKNGENPLKPHKIQSLSGAQASCHLKKDSSAPRIGYF